MVRIARTDWRDGIRVAEYVRCSGNVTKDPALIIDDLFGALQKKETCGRISRSFSSSITSISAMTLHHRWATNS